MNQDSRLPALPWRNGNRTMGSHGFEIPAALGAFVANLRFFATPKPGTPLRVLSLIAIDAVLRGRGGILESDRRRAVIEAMELGSLLNDRMDGDHHDPAVLRSAVAWFATSPYRKIVRPYAASLRRYERGRPDAGEGLRAVACYRENVNETSLAFLWAIASKISFRQAREEIRVDSDLRLLFKIIMQCQLIDDTLDVRKDLKRGLPSFATARGTSVRALLKLTSAYSNLHDDSRVSCLMLALKAVAAFARTTILISRFRIGRVPGRASCCEHSPSGEVG